MKHYITIGANDLPQSLAFYDSVLATIGYEQLAYYEGYGKGYSKDGKNEGLVIWVLKPFNKETATFGNGSMVGLNVGSRAEVDAFFKVVLANGGTSEGEPGHRPYTPTWYGAYVRDPVGNKFSVFCDE
jgi:catechol 2,3-dioxygenase-like lactoylglutathione lyase family enzyme